ncbi:uncharacterized protein [Rutidosis leptorrhynchoides]|uniref:uncharacterized protein n=1 Tax=Rutidosis leptorrhynchoides TaxID=125765 RepID=UPI003A995091
MGCGKSKHAVETATTITKSSKSDGGKETHTTKTVTEKGDASVVQHEVETTSRVVEDTKKEIKTTKIEPGGVVNTGNVATVSGDSIGNAVDVVKEDDKVKDLDSTRVHDTTTNDNVAPTTPVIEEKKEPKPIADNEAKTDNAGTMKVVKEDEPKKESDKKKTDNVAPVEVKGTRETKLAKDNNVKAEFMTPRMDEEVAKDDVEVKDLEEEEIADLISKKSTETITIADQEVVDSVVDSPIEETDKEEDVEVTDTEVDNVKTSPETTKSKKVLGLKEANTA